MSELIQSYDYSAIKFKAENRDIHETNVHRIMESMKVYGFSPAKPIHVNSNMEIIDGQHRFVAATKLGIPFYYVIDDQFDFITANSTSRCLCSADYAKYHATLGEKAYQDILNYTLKYKINTSLIIALICKGKKNKSFQLGDIKLILDNEAREKLIQYFVEFRDFCLKKKIKPKSFATARIICRVFNFLYSLDFDFKGFLDSLPSTAAMLMWTGEIKSQVMNFIDMYNHKKRKKIPYPDFSKLKK